MPGCLSSPLSVPLSGCINYTVKQTIAATQIATLQTMAMEEGKDLVLSVTLKDGSTAKYRIQSPTAEALAAATKEGVSKQKVSSYDLEQSGYDLTIGEVLHCLSASH